MKILIFTAALILIAGASTAQEPSSAGSVQRGKFDGSWWVAANPGEQSGFINGVSDCMTWDAHIVGYSSTPEQLDDKITKFYQVNSNERHLDIIEVWARVSPVEKRARIPNGGETWSNPHWYLNGDWWSQLSPTEQTGFVEGYLWCSRTRVEKSRAKYSEPSSFYRAKINGFVKANPKLGKEAVARTLIRFKDRDDAN